MKPVQLRAARQACVAMLLCFAAPIAAVETADLPSASELDDLLLFEVRLGQRVLSGAIPAHQVDDEVFLPLGEVSALLSIAVVANPVAGTASGFVINESRRFYLDAQQGTVKLDGSLEEFDPALVRIHDDDIYVARKLLARWLPVDFEIDLSALWLQVRPREPLPLEMRLDRERRSEAGRLAFRPIDPGYPFVESPYRWMDTPFIDQTLSTDLRRDDAGSHTSARSTTYVTGDLLNMQGAGYLRLASEGETADYRFTLGRTDPDASLLGPLHARAFALGSVPIEGVLNVARTRARGNGVSVSNYPLLRPQRFDTQSFSGPLPPGWDVEVYYNGVLIGYQQSRQDGTYEFDDLPLRYGRNDFRLVFRGPQGELREEEQSFLVGASRTEPGTLYYRVAAHLTEDTDATSTDGIKSTAQFDWGLNRWLSLAGGLSSVTVANEDRRYTNVGLRASWESVFVSTDLAHSETGGTALEFGVRTRLMDTAFAFDHTQLSNFESNVFKPSADPLRMSDRLSADGTLGMLDSLRLPYNVTVERDVLKSGAVDLRGRARVAGIVRGATFTNQLSWQSFADTKTLNGTLGVARRFDRFGLRGQVGYRLRPDARLTTVTLSTDRRFAGGYVTNLGVNRALETRQTLFTVGVNKTLGSFALGANLGYSTDGSMSAGLRLFVSAGREPRQGEWRLDSQPTAGAGGVSARVFIDKNLNGTMDEGEEPISGVGFTVNGGRQSARTGMDGTAYLGRVPVTQHVDLGIVTNTLEDPQWIADPGGVRLLPRPGRVIQVEFPIVLATEIDGTIRVTSDGQSREIGDVTVELVDASGAVVATGVSVFDGFYIIEAVRPGDYQVRVSAEDARRLGMDAPPPRAVTVLPDGEYVSGIDLELVPAQP